MKGLIHIYTGDGKGKTTAALGLAIRAAGRNKRVLFVQFFKGGDSGELHILKNIPNIDLLRLTKSAPTVKPPFDPCSNFVLPL